MSFTYIAYNIGLSAAPCGLLHVYAVREFVTGSNQSGPVCQKVAYPSYDRSGKIECL